MEMEASAILTFVIKTDAFTDVLWVGLSDNVQN